MSSLVRAFSIDYRSLRFGRAAVGLMILVHAAHLLWNRADFFSEGGIIPWELVTHDGSYPVYSLFSLSHAPWMALLHFGGLALCGIGLIYNLLPRLSSALAYLLVISINNRIPFGTYGVDRLYPVMLFWFSVLPPGRGADERASSFTSFASIGVLLQIAWIYVSTGHIKSFDFYFTQGLGAYAALKLDMFARPLGAWAAEAVPLTIWQWLSRAVLLWERYGALLIFSPWRWATCRILVFGGFALMHVSFGALLAIGTFPGADLVFLVILLPGELWDRVGARYPSLPKLRTYSRSSVPVDALAPVIFAMFFCASVWNLKAMNFWVWVPPPVKWFAQMTAMDQNWGMFAPTPFNRDGWFVIEGEQVGGLGVDVLKGRGYWPDFAKPERVSAMFNSERWIVMSTSFDQREAEPRRHAWADYFCRQSSRAGWPLEKINIWFVHEGAVAQGEIAPLTRRLLLSKRCDGLEAAR